MEWMLERILPRKIEETFNAFAHERSFSVDNWSFAQSFFFAVTVVTTIG